MKKLVLSAAILVCGAGGLLANSVFMNTAASVSALLQEKKPVAPAVTAKKQAQKLTKELSLTAGQNIKLEAAILQRITQQQAIQKKSAGDKALVKAEMKPVSKQYNNTLKSILTEAQFAQFNANNAAKAKAKKAKGKA